MKRLLSIGEVCAMPACEYPHRQNTGLVVRELLHV